MPANVRPVRDELDGLLAFLAQQRLTLRAACFGLTDEQARLTPTPSTLSVGGLVKHLADMESGWMRTMLGLPEVSDEGDAAATEAYDDGFRLRADETLAQVLDRYAEVAAQTERLVRAEESLDRPVPVPKGVPWFPQDVDAWSVRWVLLHLIQETARHAGHADIVREAVDGANAIELLAGLEGWPASDWVRPWEPAGV
ncbi:DinB family protein [Motilibacter aurantiacus]|uniref:DinB family protein n=1 Tax=Motilibacter aurantiacus TaxID=2714955 RepID=UPI00140A6790|nr:DinB family protein [Motilibacter aurantiacus]NHC44948.1 DinB family protein [Motilibacter aurantiacus]